MMTGMALSTSARGPCFSSPARIPSECMYVSSLIFCRETNGKTCRLGSVYTERNLNIINSITKMDRFCIRDCNRSAWTNPLEGLTSFSMKTLTSLLYLGSNLFGVEIVSPFIFFLYLPERPLGMLRSYTRGPWRGETSAGRAPAPDYGSDRPSSAPP